MLKRLMSRMYRNQKGITGLETAIILIAFVVVAAVFAYTVLSAGLFATEESSEAVYSGLEEAKSTLEIKGGVTAYCSTPGTPGAENVLLSGGGATTATERIITRIQFAAANVLGGDPIDLTPDFTATTVDPPSTLADPAGDNHETVITYQDKTHYFNDCAYTVEWIGLANQDNLLEANEKALITLWLVPHADANEFDLPASSDIYFDDTDDGANGSNNFLTASDSFTVEVKTPKGAVLTMTRSLPDYLDPTNDLH